jgi:hypothetical protein
LEKKKYYEAANLIIRYKFQSHFDIKEIVGYLVDLNKLGTAVLLISDNEPLKIHLVKSLATNDNCKKAAKLIKDFKFDPNDFPEVKERVMKNSMRYFLGRNLYQKKSS